ncbi:MAG: Stp1/IreP family PP2C-type Ser/Thr phosphatase [Erysipelotrichaceae bacterium]
MRYGASTSVGVVRKSNQDSFSILFNDYGDLFGIVCDGVGGNKAGDVASSIVAKCLSDDFSKLDKLGNEDQIRNFFDESIVKANTRVYTLSKSNPEYRGMGTTLVAFVCLGDKLFFANIGDSRGYVLKNGQLLQITTDQTVPNDLLEKGLITAEQAKNHPKKHVLINAIGIDKTITYDYFKIDGFEKVLLCSDGLYSMIEDNAVFNIINDGDYDINTKVGQLIDRANNNGGYDNITVILVER